MWLLLRGGVCMAMGVPLQSPIKLCCNMSLRTAVCVHVAVYLVPHWVSIHESGVGMTIGAYLLTQLKKKKMLIFLTCAA